MARRNRPGWTKIGAGVHSGCGATWRHDASGAEVRHCGHPTALYPYYGIVPGREEMLLSPNGRAFQYLADAQQAVEEHLQENATDA